MSFEKTFHLTQQHTAAHGEEDGARRECFVAGGNGDGRGEEEEHSSFRFRIRLRSDAFGCVMQRYYGSDLVLQATRSVLPALGGITPPAPWGPYA